MIARGHGLNLGFRLVLKNLVNVLEKNISKLRYKYIPKVRKFFYDVLIDSF